MRPPLQLLIKEKVKPELTSPCNLLAPLLPHLSIPQYPSIHAPPRVFGNSQSYLQMLSLKPYHGCSSHIVPNCISNSENQLTQLLLMLTNAASKETDHNIVEDNSALSVFRYDWNAECKDEYEQIDKSHSPHYTNLTSASPSSSESGNLILRHIQLPKIEPSVLHHCAVCSFVILDKEISIVDGKCYHNNCVRCSMCDTAFEFNEKCFSKNGVLLCRLDYAKRFHKCCRKCDQPLNKEDMVMKAKELIFHHTCFVCFICGAKLITGDYYTMSPQGHLYCHAHYDVVRTAVLCEEPTPPTVPAVVVPPAPPTTTPAAPPTAPENPPREPSTEAEGSTDEDATNGHQRSKRMRTSFKHHQLRAMKTYFALNHNPDAKDLKQLAAKTNLTKRVLQVWFQNARAKYRRGLQDGGRSSPLCVSAPLSAMDLNPPLSSSSSGHSTDGYQLSTPPLSTDIYDTNSNYTNL